MTTTIDRRVYLSNPTLNQDFLDQAQGNLENRLVFLATITHPDRVVRVSSIDTYLDGFFYQNRAEFPQIKRTVGEFLESDIEFSEIEITVNNTDGEYNDILPGGVNYKSWINSGVVIQLGVGEDSNNYLTIFQGVVSSDGGFSRSTKGFTLKCRDRFEPLTAVFPTATFNQTEFPHISEDLGGRVKPYFIGDWTTEVNAGGSIPGLVVNSLEPGILDPNGDNSGFTTNVLVFLSDHDNFDLGSVYLKRGEALILLDAADVIVLGSGQKLFAVRNRNSGSTTQVDGEAYAYAQGDQFLVRVKSQLKGGGSLFTNAVAIAKDILKTFGGISLADFSVRWDQYQNKTTPAASAVANILARMYIDEEEPIISFANSLLGQVGLEIFIDKENNISLNPLHADEFESSPSFIIRNDDVEEGSFKPIIDDRTNLNRLAGLFNRLPDIGESASQSAYYFNITNFNDTGVTFSERLNLPNLYARSQVELRVQDILSLTSAFAEFIELSCTWRSLLLDIGDYVLVDVKIGSVIFEQVPCQIREKTYDPQGLRIGFKLWSFQLLPFGSWPGQGGGIVGGNAGTLLKE